MTLTSQLCNAVQPLQDGPQEAGEQQVVMLAEQLINSQSEIGKTSSTNDQQSCQDPILQYHTAVNHQYARNDHWQSPSYCTHPYPPVPHHLPCQQQYNYQLGYHHSPHPSMQHQGNIIIISPDILKALIRLCSITGTCSYSSLHRSSNCTITKR